MYCGRKISLAGQPVPETCPLRMSQSCPGLARLFGARCARFFRRPGAVSGNHLKRLLRSPALLGQRFWASVFSPFPGRNHPTFFATPAWDLRGDSPQATAGGSADCARRNRCLVVLTPMGKPFPDSGQIVGTRATAPPDPVLKSLRRIKIGRVCRAAQKFRFTAI